MSGIWRAIDFVILSYERHQPFVYKSYLFPGIVWKNQEFSKLTKSNGLYFRLTQYSMKILLD